MNGNQSQARIDEMLSAYIDGELSPQERQRLEAWMAAEPDLRHRLEGLQRTVMLVQQLPRVEAPRNFLLAPSMVEEKEDRPRRISLRWLAPALTFASALSALMLVAVLILGGLGGRMTTTLDSEPLEVAMETTQRPEEVEAPVPEMLPVPTSEDTRVFGTPVEEAAEAPEEPPILAQEAPTGTVGVISDTITAEAPAGGEGVSPTPTPSDAGFNGQPPTVEETEIAALPMPEDEEEGDRPPATGSQPSPVVAPETERGEAEGFDGRDVTIVGLAVLTLGLAMAAGFAWRSRRR